MPSGKCTVNQDYRLDYISVQHHHAFNIPSTNNVLFLDLQASSFITHLFLLTVKSVYLMMECPFTPKILCNGYFDCRDSFQLLICAIV